MGEIMKVDSSEEVNNDDIEPLLKTATPSKYKMWVKLRIKFLRSIPMYSQGQWVSTRLTYVHTCAYSVVDVRRWGNETTLPNCWGFVSYIKKNFIK